MIVGVKIFLLLCTGRDTGSEGKVLVKCGGCVTGMRRRKRSRARVEPFIRFPNAVDDILFYLQFTKN